MDPLNDNKAIGEQQLQPIIPPDLNNIPSDIIRNGGGQSYIADQFKSANWKKGQQGWMLSSNGDYEFNFISGVAQSIVPAVGSSLGASSTQFDITNPSGTTMRYTYDGTGTDPVINTTTFPIGATVQIYSVNFNAGNNFIGLVTGSGSNYFEVDNSGGVAENNKTLGTTGYLIISSLWTKPAGLKYVILELVGGGGGGSGSGTASTGGAGGGGGGYSKKIIQASLLGATEIMIVGAGGIGGAAGNNNGNSGQTTSFGSHASATGGDGGNIDGSGSGGSVGGAGGAGSNGDFNTTGQAGDGGSPNSSGSGGGSFLGGGGNGLDGGSGNVGTNGTGYGGGGSGAYKVATNKAGGNGKTGIILITQYF